MGNDRVIYIQKENIFYSKSEQSILMLVKMKKISKYVFLVCHTLNFDLICLQYYFVLRKYYLEYNIPVHVIPFLPLTRDHVRSCIHAELRYIYSFLSKDHVFTPNSGTYTFIRLEIMRSCIHAELRYIYSFISKDHGRSCIHAELRYIYIHSSNQRSCESIRACIHAEFLQLEIMLDHVFMLN